MAEGKALLTTTLGIEFYQVAGDILDMFLGAFLQALPLAGAKCGESRSLATILRPVFRYFI